MTTRRSSAVEAPPGRSNLSSLVLYTGFGLTGAGTVMLGVLLPLLSQKWGLRDDAAGFLLFLQFLGSSLGAFFAGANRIRSLAAGYGLLAVSACALVFSGLHISFVIFFFFGLGLGMAMTSTSLLFSDRSGDGRATKLERLNFAWAAGATAAPVLFMPFLHGASLRALFFTLQGLFLLLFVWVIFKESQETQDAPANVDAPQIANRTPFGYMLPLVVLAMCSVGVEASLSGWLTTYSHRADPQGGEGAALATSIFWSGVVLSRLVSSTRLMAIAGRHTILRATLWGVVVSVALLIAAHNPASIRIAAGLAGLSIGPVYPLLLSFLLERSARGWIFAVSGMGSAILPWLTGLLSAHFASLRYGLIAPCAAAMLMIILRAVCLRPASSSRLHEPSQSQTGA